MGHHDMESFSLDTSHHNMGSFNHHTPSHRTDDNHNNHCNYNGLYDDTDTMCYDSVNNFSFNEKIFKPKTQKKYENDIIPKPKDSQLLPQSPLQIPQQNNNTFVNRSLINPMYHKNYSTINDFPENRYTYTPNDCVQCECIPSNWYWSCE